MRIRYWQVETLDGTTRHREGSLKAAKATHDRALAEFGEARTVFVEIEGDSLDIVAGILGEANDDGTRADSRITIRESKRLPDGRITETVTRTARKAKA